MSGVFFNDMISYVAVWPAANRCVADRGIDTSALFRDYENAL